MSKLDLNKLKTEIDSRKKERGVNSSMPPKDEFLNGLLNSLQTGRSNSATNLIKLVENKTAEKNKEKPIHSDVAVVSTNPQTHQLQPQQRNTINESPDRDDLLWAEIEKRKKQTLSEQMNGFISSNPNPVNNQNPQMNLNKGYLVENVKKVVNNYLIENLSSVLEEAIKSTILEMYAVERIKEVLTENKEMVKTLVYETIREIQNKKKAQ